MLGHLELYMFQKVSSYLPIVSPSYFYGHARQSMADGPILPGAEEVLDETNFRNLEVLISGIQYLQYKRPWPR